METHNLEQGTSEWFAVRAGKPTASEFKKVFTATGKPSTQMKDYAALLAAEMYAGGQLESWEGNQWTERGNELEAEARALYELETGNDVTEVGFITNGDIGCSPDGLVGDVGLVEIKCLSPAKHVQAIAYINKHGKPPSDYIPQLHGQIMVTGRKWVDFWLYHPALPSVSCRVPEDNDYQVGLLQQLNLCIEQRNKFIEMLRPTDQAA